MEKTKVKFTYLQQELEYTCNLGDKILNTFQKSAEEFGLDLSDLIFLCNADKIDFNKDFTKNYTFDDISKKALDKSIIQVLILDYDYHKEINMMITEDYIREWGFKEGLREFLQNQHDGIINYVLKEENLIIKGIGDKYKNRNNSEDFDKFLNFEFFNKKDNEKLGEIIYDEEMKNLTIINKGEIILGNLNLGSKKEKNTNNEIIGQFGEGMKLGILALLRSHKNIKIISSDRNFDFELKLKEDNDSKILYCILQKYKKKDMKNKVKVVISNISKDEWNDEIFKFLWLLDRENFNIHLSEKSGEKIGEVLAEPIFENKLYCKGIYVQNIEKKKDVELESKHIPGFNVYDLKLDRDRNCAENQYDMIEKFGETLSYALKTDKRYLNYSNYTSKTKKEEKEEEKKEEKKITKTNSFIYDIDNSEIVDVEDYGNKYLSEKLISLLNDKDISFSQDYFFNYKIQYSITKDEADKLWRTWEKINYIEHRKPPKYQPADSETIQKLLKFFEKNKLNQNFYLIFEVSKSLMELLQKSSLYLGYEEKLEKYIINSPNVDKTPKVNNYLDILEKKVKIPNFTKDFVEFKKYDIGNDIYYYDDKQKKLYFSYLRINDINNIETKYWMFTNILKTMNIQIENSYNLYKNFFLYILK